MILKRENVEKVAEGEKARALIAEGFIVIRGDLEETAEEPVTDFSGMTVKELRKHAKKLGIAGANALTKSELLEVLNDRV